MAITRVSKPLAICRFGGDDRLQDVAPVLPLADAGQVGTDLAPLAVDLVTADAGDLRLAAQDAPRPGRRHRRPGIRGREASGSSSGSDLVVPAEFLRDLRLPSACGPLRAARASISGGNLAVAGAGRASVARTRVGLRSRQGAERGEGPLALGVRAVFEDILQDRQRLAGLELRQEPLPLDANVAARSLTARLTASARPGSSSRSSARIASARASAGPLASDDQSQQDRAGLLERDRPDGPQRGQPHGLGCIVQQGGRDRAQRRDRIAGRSRWGSAARDRSPGRCPAGRPRRPGSARPRRGSDGDVGPRGQPGQRRGMLTAVPCGRSALMHAAEQGVPTRSPRRSIGAARAGSAAAIGTS